MIRNGLLAIALVALAGCEQAETVDFYAENKEAREAKVAECQTGPLSYNDYDQDCVNAFQAGQKLRRERTQKRNAQRKCRLIELKAKSETGDMRTTKHLEDPEWKELECDEL
ncbi:EexN family lipoprotein [Alterisphingorhabdus coralli]|uniref:EexN family lipoprotein n=1 Tax=Alterisphingorhabdus coralli TaxID=3071408 RepID=A0AA97F744_9SPHN|nr:EexN family lipoprotein [Parasphingorhabdus sp. SCSIO 66989]WOE73750.1 EexN family lipoprotein [Parasphingorhabdus sp. SCSIO 66989]